MIESTHGKTNTARTRCYCRLRARGVELALSIAPGLQRHHRRPQRTDPNGWAGLPGHTVRAKRLTPRCSSAPGWTRRRASPSPRPTTSTSSLPQVARDHFHVPGHRAGVQSAARRLRETRFANGGLLVVGRATHRAIIAHPGIKAYARPETASSSHELIVTGLNGRG